MAIKGVYAGPGGTAQAPTLYVDDDTGSSALNMELVAELALWDPAVDPCKVVAGRAAGGDRGGGVFGRTLAAGGPAVDNATVFGTANPLWRGVRLRDTTVNALWFGPAGNAAFQAALTMAAALTNGVVLLPYDSGNWSITADTTVPANVELHFERGAWLTIANAKTLTVLGAITAPPSKILATVGTGAIDLSQAHLPPHGIDIRWTGAALPGDNTAAIQAAIDCYPNDWRGTARVYIPPVQLGGWTCAGTLHAGGSRNLSLEGDGYTKTGVPGRYGAAWQWVYRGSVIRWTADVDGIDSTGSAIYLDQVELVGFGAGTGRGIAPAVPILCRMNDVLMGNWPVAILGNMVFSFFHRLTLWGNDIGIGNGTIFSSITMRDLSLRGNNVGFDLDSAENVHVTGGMVNANVIAIRLANGAGGVRQIKFASLYIESNGPLNHEWDWLVVGAAGSNLVEWDNCTIGADQMGTWTPGGPAAGWAWRNTLATTWAMHLTVNVSAWVIKQCDFNDIIEDGCVSVTYDAVALERTCNPTKRLQQVFGSRTDAPLGAFGVGYWATVDAANDWLTCPGTVFALNDPVRVVADVLPTPLALTTDYYAKPVAGKVFTADVGTGYLNCPLHGYTDNMPFRVSSTVGLPPPLVAGTTYYAHVIDANNIQVMSQAVPGLSWMCTRFALPLTGAGVGVHTMTPQRYQLAAAPGGLAIDLGALSAEVLLGLTADTAFTPDYNNGPIQRVLVDRNMTIAAPAGVVPDGTFSLILMQDAVGHTVTFNAAYGLSPWVGGANQIKTVNCRLLAGGVVIVMSVYPSLENLYAGQADAGNSHTGALGAGATWVGTNTSWGAATKLEVVGTNDQAGTLVFRQRVAGVWKTEQWAVPITAVGSEWTAVAARIPEADQYNVQFVNGGVANAALEVAARVTIGEVDHLVPMKTDTGAILAGANATIVRPVGARWFDCIGTQDDHTGIRLMLTQRDAAGDTLDPSQCSEGLYGLYPLRKCHSACVDVYLWETDAQNSHYEIHWYY